MNKKTKYVLFIICILCYLYTFSKHIFASYIPSDCPFSITFIPVGKGDCIIVQYVDQTMMVDTGYLETSNEVVDYLKSNNITTIDYLILTHPHKDHIGGAPAILENFEVSTIYKTNVTYNSSYYKDLEKALSQKDYNVLNPTINEQIQFGEAIITFLGPLNEDYLNINNTSIVVKIEYQGKSILLTGDMLIEAEQDLIDSGINLSSDIIKIGHHGNSDSSLANFINAVNPNYAIITCDSTIMMSPDMMVLYRLLTHNVQVLRTDIDGLITFYINQAGEIFVKTKPLLDLPTYI